MKILITGGAGFIGCNLAARLLRGGHAIVIVDDLSRPGTDKNLSWLREHGPFEFHREDVRRAEPLAAIFARNTDTTGIVHLASQVAVTTSVTNPRHDFEVNAAGTFNVLEATRQHCPNATLLYASTNKVYGGLHHLEVVETDGRYAFASRPHGVSEGEPLDFHSPYGCSKGAADQYVIDYARIYGLRTLVFRQSCIYGTRQLGIEDQGWVAWFTIAALFDKSMTIYGDGKQVRDVLFVDDLCDLYETCLEHPERARGQAYNIGGGPKNQLSLLELLADLERRIGRPLRPARAPTRPGDQPVFVADVRKAERDLGWVPKTSVEAGLSRLFDWVVSHRDLLLG